MPPIPAEHKVAESLAKLLETTQDIFIFQGLQAGLTVETIRDLIRVNQVRVTRVSKIHGKIRARKKADR